MSRRIEKSNLKTLAILRCDAAEARGAAPRDEKSRRSNPKKRQRVEKAALRLQGKGRAAARTTKPKKIAKAPAGSEPIDDSVLLMANALKDENASVDNTITVNPVVPRAEAEFQGQELPQSVGPSVGNETRPGLVTAVDLVVDHPPRILFAESSIEEKEEPEVDAVREQTEVSTHIETYQPTEVQRRTILKWLTAAWEWARKQMGSRQVRKRLRVCESVSLGEKRFVAVIEVDGEQFLVGGAASSVATLARLEPSPEFAEILKRRWAQDPIEA